jgi:hypothetical protein
MFQNYETGENVDIKNLILISLKTVKDYQAGTLGEIEMREFIFNSNLGEVSICKPWLKKAEEQFIILGNPSLRVLEEAINFRSEVN